MLTLQIPQWSTPLFRPARYKSIRGGRSSSKTWTVATILVKDALEKPRNIYCCREIESTIDISSKAAIETMIRRMGVGDQFQVFADRIVGNNGSLFRFYGTEKKRENIPGWEGVDRLWVEQAERMSVETAKLLIPTLFRRPGAEAYFTWNPINRTDWVWDRFVENARASDISLVVNWRDNPFFPPDLDEERQELYASDPLLYPHIWEGEPYDASGDTRVLAYSILRDCVEAHRRDLHKHAGKSPIDSGLDIGDGRDKNAQVVRYGPVIDFADEWPAVRAGYLTPTATRADQTCFENNVWRLYFDSTGVGSPMRGELNRLLEERQEKNKAFSGYISRGVNFGQAVGGPKKFYTRGKTNSDTFARRNAQMAFALRLRANRTVALLQGNKDVDPNECLFISPKIPQLERYMAILSRPLWRINPTSGKIEIDKRQKAGNVQGTGDESPDLFDATTLAFARDSDSGLRSG